MRVLRWLAAAASAVLLPASLAMAQSADMSIVTTGPATVIAGTNIAFDVTVTNNGPDAATVVMNMVFPAGTTFVSFTQNSGVPAAVPLAVGASDNYTVVLGVNAGVAQGTVLSFFTDLTTSVADPNLSNNSSIATTTVVGSADLAVTKSAPATATAGADIAYAVGITNNGPTDALNVALVDGLPAGTTFVSLVQNTGPAFACATPAVGAGGAVSCTLGTFPNAASATFTLTVATSPGAAGTNVLNTASATSTTSDPAPANNSASASTLLPLADVAIAIGGPSSFVAGGSLTYGMTIANNGPDDAAGISLSDALPAGTTFFSFVQNTGPAFACVTPAVGAAGTVSCTLASMPSGATASFTLVARTSAGVAGSTISNAATVTATTTDPSLANNTATASALALDPPRVPALGKWAMLLLAALLSGAAFAALRRG